MPNLILSLSELAQSAAPVSGAENAAPVGSTPAPVGSTPAPVGSTPAPVGSTPAPAGSTPAPVGSTAAPVGSTAAPVGSSAAPQAPPPSNPLTGMMLPLLLCAVVFYFLVLGPERKQRKKRDEMLKKLGKGDKVMTTGGLYASVVAVQDDVVTLQIADGVRARFSRSAIQVVITDEQPSTEKVDAEKAIAKR